MKETKYLEIGGRTFQLVERPSEIKSLYERFNSAYCRTIWDLYQNPSSAKVSSFETLRKWCEQNGFDYKVNGGKMSGYYSMYARKDNMYIVFSGQTSDKLFYYGEPKKHSEQFNKIFDNNSINVEEFKKWYDNLNPLLKTKIKDSDILLNNIEQAKEFVETCESLNIMAMLFNL